MVGAPLAGLRDRVGRARHDIAGHGPRGRGEPAPQAPPPRVARRRRGAVRRARASAPMPMSAPATPISDGRQPILQVRDLAIEFDAQSRAAARGRRRELRPAPRRDARAGRRVWLRQDDDRARPHAPPSSRREDRRRLGLVRRRGPGGTRRACAASVPLDPPLARLPGSHERAEPGPHGGRPDHRGDSPPLPGDVQGRGQLSARASSSSASGSRPGARASTRTPTPAACVSAR